MLTIVSRLFLPLWLVPYTELSVS